MNTKKYLPSQIERKWQKRWVEENLYKSNLGGERKHYVLAEFAYPSGDLHMGHWFTFGGTDIYARTKRMQGYSVFFPNGFDAFGLPAENAAIKRGIHPKDWTYQNIARMKEQYGSMGASFSFDHEVITSNPLFYRWNQWLFLKMFEKGLAYRGKALSNWCPSCQTVLANEGIEEGKCWRCHSIVEQKEVEQWFFKITEYADKLLWDNTGKEMSNGVDWPQSVREGQNNWIGKSEGLIFTAPVKDSDIKIKTFSAHFEAFCADTFVVIAPDHPLLEELIKEVPNKQEVGEFATKIVQERMRNGHTEGKTLEGIFTGKYIIDPVGNGELPIWVASYALRDYGTGIVKCSAHDERDFAFAKKYNIRLKPVLFPKDPALKKKVEDLEICYTDMKNGYLSEPSAFAGKLAGSVRRAIIEYVQKKGHAVPTTTYHIRDWSISRQRYWGTPIPIIYCGRCWELKVESSKLKVEGRDFIIRDGKEYAIVPLAEEDLPVELPYDVDYTPKGKPPLASNSKWLSVSCPVCGGIAQRDGETMDTFVDSSWYFFRYLSPTFTSGPFDSSLAEKWMPVAVYIGGAEHTLGHTLYSRFITKFFKTLGLIDFEEYALRRINHGVILGPDGFRMSKSRGNVVNPDEEVKKYGADTVRVYLAFFMPYEGTGPWISERVWGAHRFLQRVWKLFDKYQISNIKYQISNEDLRTMHRTIKKVTEDIENIKFNTAVAALMEWLNYLSRKENVSGEEYKTLLLLLAPFAPHITEELYERFKNYDLRFKNEKVDKIHKSYIVNHQSFDSIHLQPWPQYDEKYLREDMVMIVVQVNGKVRDTIKTQNLKLKTQNSVEETAKKSKKVMKYIEGKTIKKVVYVEGKVLNFVVND